MGAWARTGGGTLPRVFGAVFQRLDDRVRPASEAVLAVDRLGALHADPWSRFIASATHPGGNPGANRWFLQSTPIQMPPESGGICGRLT